jgi:hypothetical protein
MAEALQGEIPCRHTTWLEFTQSADAQDIRATVAGSRDSILAVQPRVLDTAFLRTRPVDDVLVGSPLRYRVPIGLSGRRG